MFTAVLKIEIDGHFHGGEPVKPWVAEIRGTCPRFGLQRKFLDPLNDWSQSKRAWSGNVYGRVSHFPLREGKLYEVQRCRGRSSKRHVVREFERVVGGKREKLTPEDALAIADGGGDAAVISVKEGDQVERSWVARITGLGTPERIGFVIVDFARRYRLVDGLYEVMERGKRSYVGVRDQQVQRLDHEEAIAWLRR